MVEQFPALIIAAPGRWRDSLCVLLQASGQIHCIWQADNGREGLRMLVSKSPMLVLLSVNLLGHESWWTLRKIKLAGSQPPCVVFVNTAAEEKRARSTGAEYVLQMGFSSESFFKVLAEINSRQQSSTDNGVRDSKQPDLPIKGVMPYRAIEIPGGS
jgi:DNA-binding NarL/FixJ family response regulator